MRVFTIYETTQIRNNNWVNNGFFVNNIFARVYGKNKPIGRVIKVVRDYWYEADKPILGDEFKKTVKGISKDPLLTSAITQSADTITQMTSNPKQKKKYYNWYLVELDDTLPYGRVRKYVREDVVRLSK